MSKKEYALYHGENFIMIGTIEEIAKYLGIKKKSVMFYQSPTHKKRDPNGYAVVAIPEDEEGLDE